MYTKDQHITRGPKPKGFEIFYEDRYEKIQILEVSHDPKGSLVFHNFDRLSSTRLMYASLWFC